MELNIKNFEKLQQFFQEEPANRKLSHANKKNFKEKQKKI